MSRFAERRVAVRARQAAAHANQQASIEAELARRPLASNERISGVQRMITIDDALVRAELEEPDNAELLRVVRDLWTESLQTRHVGTQWIAYETVRDGCKGYDSELAKYDAPQPPAPDAALLCPWPVLGSLGLKLKRHWETHLPKMTAQLRAELMLLHRLHETEQQMLKQEAILIQRGMSPDQARETTREIGFLPEEDCGPPPPKAAGLVERSTRLKNAIIAGLNQVAAESRAAKQTPPRK
jgi:hypothetical protein